MVDEISTTDCIDASDRRESLCSLHSTQNYAIRFVSIQG